MTTTTTTDKLICAECRHENEAERIYCHNCGERLDRSAVTSKKKVDNAEETHRRLQKLLQGPSRTRQNLLTALKLMLAAVGAAGLIQIVLPPEFPPAVKVSAPVQLDLELENAIRKSATLNYSDKDVNAYLTYRLAGKKKALDKPFLNFDRAVVVFKEGVCIIGWERSIFGYPIYSQASYRMDDAAKQISVVNTGGWIGRLPIHPAAMQYADIIFKDVWAALDRERKLVCKMSSVAFHDGSVTMTPPAVKGMAGVPSLPSAPPANQPINQSN
jgi:hypothetical protein